MARLPERLPAALSERIAGATGSIYNRFGREVDVAIGGIPFMLATNSEIPQSVETIEVRKDQFDTEVDPGEQSLAGWWRRSQSSFHQGAGFRYEPTDSDNPHNGFWDSEGVEVFEQGELSLLKQTIIHPTAGSPILGRMRTYASGGVRNNLCTNPSMETDISDWGAGGSVPPTLSHSSEQAYVGTDSLKATWGAGGSLPLVGHSSTPTWTSGVAYTVSCYVYVPTGSPNVQIVNPGLGFGGVATAKDQWVRISHDFVGEGSANQFQLWPTTPPDAGDVVYIDAVLFEEGPVLGPYFDGESPNSAWDGTQHLSTSTETTPAAAALLSAVGEGQLWKSLTAVTSAFDELHSPAGKTIVDGLIAGDSFYDVASDGTLYQGLVVDPPSATSWPCGTAPTRLMWGKHRLWIIGGRKLWQPNLNLAGGTAQNPIFTHPNQGWQYTCMTEGPSAMYFGGHDGFSSTIQAITFEAGGGIPTLSGATVTAALPDGELVQELSTVAGQFIGIGTNLGFRIGVVNEDASITYGPLIVEPEGVSACTAMTSMGRFFLVGFRTDGGKALLYKIDTSVEISDGVFAYAKNIGADMIGNVTSVATIGNRVFFSTNDGRTWYESSTYYVDEGWLQTSRIRFRTTEPKNFKFLNVEIEPLLGSMSFNVILEGGSTYPAGSVTAQGETYDAPFTLGLSPMKYASLLITMTPSEDDESPTFLSYLLRAMPAVKPQRRYILPLLCLDQERARSGQVYGGKGYAQNRLTALQLLEDAAETLVYQDFSSGGSEGRLVTIDSIRYVQTSPALPHRDEGAGGILILQLRTADA